MEEVSYLNKEEKNKINLIKDSLSENDKEFLKMLIDKEISFDLIKLCLMFDKTKTYYLSDKEKKYIQNINDILNLKISIDGENTYEDFRNMIVIIAQDYRVLICVLLIRLFQMKKLKKEDFIDKKMYGQISLNIYAPMAHRLGLGNIKSELEELSLYFIDYDNYKKIGLYLEEKKEKRDEKNNKIINQTSDKLDKVIKNYKIFGRSKSLYSIYKKTTSLNKSFSEIYDFQGIRIICETKEECYSALGVVHENYTPLPNRFKDYIAIKKPNLYQSLHTTVSDRNGDIFEFQIRTFKMDEIAERGIAAHWLYKNENNKSLKDVEEQLHLFRDIIKSNEKEDDNAINKDIFESTIYTFTPKRKIIMLPQDATVIDFAYKIHTKVGENISNAIVNDKIVSFNTILKNGDQVKIITKENNDSVQKEWLGFVKTAHARKKIKSYLNNKKAKFDREKENEGFKQIKKLILNHKLRYDIVENEEEREIVLKALNIKTIETLYKEFYLQNINTKTINEIELEDKKINIKEVKRKSNKTGVYVKGIENIKMNMAKCCYPIYGDDIIGVIKNGDAIIVHKKDCDRIEGLNQIDVFWEKNSNVKFLSKIYIEALYRSNLYNDITTTLSKQKIPISTINSKEFDELLELKIEVYINDKNQLHELINSLKNIEGVVEVKEDKN